MFLFAAEGKITAAVFMPSAAAGGAGIKSALANSSDPAVLPVTGSEAA
jgi:hypothetical protein